MHKFYPQVKELQSFIALVLHFNASEVMLSCNRIPDKVSFCKYVAKSSHVSKNTYHGKELMFLGFSRFLIHDQT